MKTLSGKLVKSACVAFVLSLILMALFAIAQNLKSTETVIAGGPDKFVEVRHVILTGSNFEIGKRIGEIAKKDGALLTLSDDRVMNRAKKEYMAKNYPIYYERMKGVAAAYGVDFADDSYDCSQLFQTQLTPAPGCSVVFYPAKVTENGHSILSRNYDFTTGDMWSNRKLPRGELAMMSRPYLFEIHPDQGYSSLSLCAFDYLGGVLEGINSEGLAVAILSVAESIQKAGYEPSHDVGMHELMSMRYLLDNCKNVEEAKVALLFLKHHYFLIPCHYIVGDKSGKSFVFEFSPGRNRDYIIDGEGPQCITNHLLFLHPKNAENAKPNSSHRRYNKLEESIQGKDKFTLDEIAAINEKVSESSAILHSPEFAPYRTLWYAQYDLDNLSINVKFYLGEKPDPENGNQVIIEYSTPKVFALTK